MKLWEYLSCGRRGHDSRAWYGETVEAGVGSQRYQRAGLARQLVRLLEDPDAPKMGERGRMAVIQAHTWGTS
jgi:hypothetical protein